MKTEYGLLLCLVLGPLGACGSAPDVTMSDSGDLAGADTMTPADLAMPGTIAFDDLAVSRSDGPPAPSTNDAGADGGESCGAAAQPCCASVLCNDGLTCAGGICTARPGDGTGQGCVIGGDCPTEFCYRLASSGFAVGLCTSQCNSTADCVAGWTCPATRGINLCQCQPTAETCDGFDNDCDGIVDDGAADQECAATTGPGYVCQSGACVCATMCDGQCVDVKTDKDHCGACEHPCAVACVSGACVVPTAIALGTDHSCALLSDGSVSCWGNYLGDSTTADSATPVPVRDLHGVSSIAAAADYTCAIESGGKLLCWGGVPNLVVSGAFGPLFPVPVYSTASVTTVATGGDHACAIISGSVHCWGEDSRGQVGSFSFNNATVRGLAGLSAIAGGSSHTCAIVSGGAVSCWGANGWGQLGNGTTFDSYAPVAVEGLSGATAVAAGDAHTCAIVSGGAVSCWGIGLLGNGATSGSSTPVAVEGLSGATAVAAGGTHTCALLSDGSVQCWGLNGLGQLGDGTTTNRTTPVAVQGLSGVTGIAAGELHTCALLSDGSVRCWGDDSYGKLGDDVNLNGTTLVIRTTPVAVVW